MSKKDENYFAELLKETAIGADTERHLKKNEQTGKELEDTLSEETKELLSLHRGRPRRKRQQEGGYIRSSFVLSAVQIEKLRAIARKEDVLLKDIVEEAFKNAIDTYEQRNGEVVLPENVFKKSASGMFSE